MTSQQKIWSAAISKARAEFEGLDAEQVAAVEIEIREIMSIKAGIAAIFDGVDGAGICRACRGECCRTGSYHFTAVDLLAHFVTSRELFSPRFDNGSCPYLGENGCLMESAYRPYNCVTFVCDRVDGGMEPDERHRYAQLSGKLIDHYRELEQRFANRFMYGILNNGARFVDGRSQGILWSGDGNNK